MGWITTDNATNNDTLLVALARELKRRFPNIPFDAVKNRIRYVLNNFCIIIHSIVPGALLM